MLFDGESEGNCVDQVEPRSNRRSPLDTTTAPSTIELRETAARLNLLADELEAKDRLPTPPRELDLHRQEMHLAYSAKRIYHDRRERRKYMPPDLLGEPAWDMLLDLFVQRTRMNRVSIKSVCMASGAPPTTALRWISLLNKYGYIRRVVCPYDRRVTWLELTDSGYLTVGRILQMMCT